MSARHLTVVHYPPPKILGKNEEVTLPDWGVVSAAIGKMDDDEYPIVQLSWKDVESCFDDEDALNIIGGPSGFAMFERVPGWVFDRPELGDEDVRLWQSDQGYITQRRNIVGTVEEVLKLARVYFDTGSYEAVEQAYSK